MLGAGLDFLTCGSADSFFKDAATSASELLRKFLVFSGESTFPNLARTTFWWEGSFKRTRSCRSHSKDAPCSLELRGSGHLLIPPRTFGKVFWLKK